MINKSEIFKISAFSVSHEAIQALQQISEIVLKDNEVDKAVDIICKTTLSTDYLYIIMNLFEWNQNDLSKVIEIYKRSVKNYNIDYLYIKNFIILIAKYDSNIISITASCINKGFIDFIEDFKSQEDLVSSGLIKNKNLSEDFVKKLINSGDFILEIIGSKCYFGLASPLFNLDFLVDHSSDVVLKQVMNQYKYVSNNEIVKRDISDNYCDRIITNTVSNDVDVYINDRIEVYSDKGANACISYNDIIDLTTTKTDISTTANIDISTVKTDISTTANIELTNTETDLTTTKTYSNTITDLTTENIDLTTENIYLTTENIDLTTIITDSNTITNLTSVKTDLNTANTQIPTEVMLLKKNSEGITHRSNICPFNNEKILSIIYRRGLMDELNADIIKLLKISDLDAKDMERIYSFFHLDPLNYIFYEIYKFGFHLNESMAIDLIRTLENVFSDLLFGKVTRILNSYISSNFTDEIYNQMISSLNINNYNLKYWILKNLNTENIQLPYFIKMCWFINNEDDLDAVELAIDVLKRGKIYDIIGSWAKMPKFNRLTRRVYPLRMENILFYKKVFDLCKDPNEKRMLRKIYGLKDI